MAQGRRARPEVRALAEALYHQGYGTADVQEIVQRVTREKMNDATLRRWRLKMRKDQAPDAAPIYAELAGRITKGDLARSFTIVMELARTVWREMPHLNLEQLSRIVVLKVWGQTLNWPDFSYLAESMAFQWEILGRLRDQMPTEDDQVRRTLSYLWSIEREVGSEVLAKAWELRKSTPAPKVSSLEKADEKMDSSRKS